MENDLEKKLLELLISSSNINEVKLAFLEWDFEFEKHRYKFYDLIIKAGYTKKIIDNPNNFKKMEFSINVLKILSSGKKIEEILDNPKKILELELNASEIIYLINLSGQTKEYLENPEKLKDLGVEETSYFVDLINFLGLANEYLENPEKLKFLDLSGYDIINLIKASGLAKEYLEDLDKLYSLNLSGNHIFKLIIDMGLLKEYLRKPLKELLDLRLNEHSNIVELIKEAGLAKEYLEDPEKLVFLVPYGKNIIELIKEARLVEEYLKQPKKLQALGLDGEDIVELIRLAGLVKEYAKKPTEELQALGLYESEIASLIEEAELAREYLENPLKHDSYSEKIMRIMRETNQLTEFLEKSDEELLNFGLLKRTIIKLRERCKLDNYILKGDEKYSVIGLDSLITIGIEIENEESIEWMSEEILDDVILLKYWRVKRDESLKDGCEVISPILTDTQSNVEEIYLICEYLQNLRSKNIAKMWRACAYWSRIFKKYRSICEFT